ncbi:hypothetical protein [Legionella drozanskii]|uniref:Uncharacterized protein n=1 Tax=Legionella drozanskii LLAP-1 TaxID=1212489 RepID=A0A0W0SVS2_9GAMM|nr:hypothetical protein [Legionella drozanskii]KTC87277.1 hypothetical protein Ldro_0896 [Legionella drozanskii LLAP-1]
MATRKESVFTSPTVFFTPVSQNLLVLEKATLKSFIDAIPDFADMLTELKKKGFFKDKELKEYTMLDFIAESFGTNSPDMDISAAQLLVKELSDTKILLTRVPETEETEEKENCEAAESETITQEQLGLLAPFVREINCYIDLLYDVLNNNLAQKPYEKTEDQENVTELQHALQAARISFILQMSLSDILALLFHDIARPSVNDAEHGHENHCKEGSTILDPLGLDIDYSGYHAFAKYLLYTFCPPYHGLISQTSVYTLGFQDKDWSAQIAGLNELDSLSLAKSLFKIMLMRLIDDMSKVPESQLKNSYDESPSRYFDESQIKKMLRKQILTHLNQQATPSSNREATIQEVQGKLEAATLLLLRAKDFSMNERLYKQYADVVDPLLEVLEAQKQSQQQTPGS